jgi:hypothetical protein
MECEYCKRDVKTYYEVEGRRDGNPEIFRLCSRCARNEVVREALGANIWSMTYLIGRATIKEES